MMTEGKYGHFKIFVDLDKERNERVVTVTDELNVVKLEVRGELEAPEVPLMKAAYAWIESTLGIIP